MSAIRRAVVLGESAGDRNAAAILCQSIAPHIEFDTQLREARGYPQVRKLVLPTLHQIVDGRIDCQALVVLVDSDDTPVAQEKPRSRLLELLKEIDKQPRFANIPIAIGVAAPAIEAWLLHNRRAGCTEASWEAELEKSPREVNPRTYKGQLKEDLYGKNCPPAKQHMLMSERTQELVEQDQLEALAKSFPHGFGTMLKTLRSWKS